MDEMIRYVFRNMKETDMTLKMMRKILARQSKINSAVNLSITAFAVCLIILERKRAEQDKRIEALEKKMKERKTAEGA